jgi:hypothetical protein
MLFTFVIDVDGSIWFLTIDMLFVCYSNFKEACLVIHQMLAVVYETFTRIEREKCRALLLHRRRATRHAFRLLVSRRAPLAIKLRHFSGLMRHYAPHYSEYLDS